MNYWRYVYAIWIVEDMLTKEERYYFHLYIAWPIWLDGYNTHKNMELYLKQVWTAIQKYFYEKLS